MQDVQNHVTYIYSQPVTAGNGIWSLSFDNISPDAVDAFTECLSFQFHMITFCYFLMHAFRSICYFLLTYLLAQLTVYTVRFEITAR